MVVRINKWQIMSETLEKVKKDFVLAKVHKLRHSRQRGPLSRFVEMRANC